MASVTVAGSNNQVFQLNYNNNDAVSYAQGLANSIDAQVASGSLTTFNYTGGNEVVFSTNTTAVGAVLVPNNVVAVVDNAAGPVSVWGGAQGCSTLLFCRH